MRTCPSCGSAVDGMKWCTRCGTALIERDDAPFDGVAPASPSGAAWWDATSAPSAATPTATPAAAAPWSPPAPAPPGGSWQAPADTAQLTVVPTGAPGRRRRGLRRVALVATGVLVIGTVAGVAVVTLWQSDAGASSPTDAVDGLVTALAAEDAIGVVNSISPSELHVVRALVDDAEGATDGTGEAADRLRDLGIDIDPDDLVPGLSVEVSDFQYDEVELADDVRRVDIRALGVNWTFDPEQLLATVDVEQLTSGAITADDLLDELERTSGSFDERDLEVDGIDPFLMTVREDGGWYVSPTYTVLEYVRQLNDLPEADFATPQGRPAATQAEAIEAFIDAVANGDVGDVIEVLPPSQYRALYAYRRALSELAGDRSSSTRIDPSVQLDQVSTFDDARGTGVTIERGTLELDITDEYDDSRHVTVQIDGPCVDATTEDEYGDTGSQRFCLDDFGEDAGPFQDGIPGIDSFWLIMREEDGGWYVDPLASVGSWLTSIDTEAFQQEAQDFLDEQLDDDKSSTTAEP